MSDRSKMWFKRNFPLVALVVFTVLALLYLGDDIVQQRESRVTLEPVAPTLQKDDPTQGTDEPVVRIFEFCDFSSPLCELESSVLKDIINNYPNDVQLVWKDAPLNNLTIESQNASIAAHCAARQNQFWGMHDLLFERQSELGTTLYDELADELSLDREEFDDCLSKRATSTIVEQNIEFANDAKVTTVPTFFINDIQYEGFVSYDDFIAALSGL